MELAGWEAPEIQFLRQSLELFLAGYREQHECAGKQPAAGTVVGTPREGGVRGLYGLVAGG